MIQKMLLGFASGIMVAASVWSLLIPAMEMCKSAGKLAFIPAAVGFSVGMVFLWVLDKMIPPSSYGKRHAGGSEEQLKENHDAGVCGDAAQPAGGGMAVGVVFAGSSDRKRAHHRSRAFALTIGIAIQNFPEGAIISLPLHSEGQSKFRALSWAHCPAWWNPLERWSRFCAQSF